MSFTFSGLFGLGKYGAGAYAELKRELFKRRSAAVREILLANPELTRGRRYSTQKHNYGERYSVRGFRGSAVLPNKSVISVYQLTWNDEHGAHQYAVDLENQQWYKRLGGSATWRVSSEAQVRAAVAKSFKKLAR